MFSSSIKNSDIKRIFIFYRAQMKLHLSSGNNWINSLLKNYFEDEFIQERMYFYLHRGSYNKIWSIMKLSGFLLKREATLKIFPTFNTIWSRTTYLMPSLFIDLVTNICHLSSSSFLSNFNTRQVVKLSRLFGRTNETWPRWVNKLNISQAHRETINLHVANVIFTSSSY